MDELFEDIETAREHLERAEKLVEDAEDQIQHEVDEMVGGNGSISASYDWDRDVFDVTVSLADVASELGEQFDADGVATGEMHPAKLVVGKTSASKEKAADLKNLIQRIEGEYENGVPVEELLKRSAQVGIDRSEVESELDRLKENGEVYEPKADHLRTT